MRREYKCAVRIDTAQVMDEEACDGACDEGGNQRAFTDALDGTELREGKEGGRGDERAVEGCFDPAE